jgi:flagellar assembly protein FliH
MAGSRRIIPREELSEFQRWQFSSLLAPVVPAESVPVAESVPESESPEPIEPEPAAPTLDESVLEEPQDILPYPTAEEIEAIEHQAHEEGYRAGLELGRQEAAAELAALREMLNGLDQIARSAEASLAADVLDLALVVARQLVRHEVSADRTLVLNVIREAIAGLPTVRSPARIQLNPADLQVVSPLLSAELESEVWRFVADPALESGACRIETPASSLDLTLASRWQSVLRVLGRESAAELDWSADLPDESDESAV